MNALTEFIYNCELATTKSLQELRENLGTTKRKLIIQLDQDAPAIVKFAIKESLRSIEDKIRVLELLLLERRQFKEGNKHLRLIK